MKKRYRKERVAKSTNNNPHPIEVQQHLDSLDPQELWEVCKPSEVSLRELTLEEQSRAVQDSRIVVFECLARRFGLGLLELRGDTIHPLGLKLDYSDLPQLDPISEFYC